MIDVLVGPLGGTVSVVLHVIAACSLVLLFAARDRVKNRAYPQCSVDDVAQDHVSFIAMQYYLGILNRSFLVILADQMLCAAKVAGVIASPLVAGKSWNDPRFYVSRREIARYLEVKLESQQFLAQNAANYQIRAADISSVSYVAKRKWGMGNVPSSGRIMLTLRNEKTVEFILLGNQQGALMAAEIRQWLKDASFSSHVG